jgi:hypothetical protein
MFDTDTLRALLAGFASGVATAFATTFVALYAMTQQVRAGRPLPVPGWERVRPALLGLMFVNGLMLLWTALGLLLGAAYVRAESARPAGGLGSPNALFTVLVAAGVGIVLTIAWYVLRRLHWTAWATAGVVLIAFGWMLPNLAR